MIDFKDAVNVISMSSGKDSTATCLLALEMDVPNRRYIFADTGNEHPLAYEYLDYLEAELGITIERYKADFSDRVIKKRDVVRGKWVNEGAVTPEEAEEICKLLVPSGNPFLDLCMWKGRFPSRRAQFCTQFLKSELIDREVMQPLIDAGEEVISWQGVRRLESPNRANLDMWEERDWHYIYRPIIDWTGQQSIDAHARHGIKPNPLYSLGMNRVGCMPCINVNKLELREIDKRFHDQIERIAEWERIVGAVAKREIATFFPTKINPAAKVTDNSQVSLERHGIKAVVEWSKTTRGGRHYDLLASDEPVMCSSNYGLCE